MPAARGSIRDLPVKSATNQSHKREKMPATWLIRSVQATSKGLKFISAQSNRCKTNWGISEAMEMIKRPSGRMRPPTKIPIPITPKTMRPAQACFEVSLDALRTHPHKTADSDTGISRNQVAPLNTSPIARTEQADAPNNITRMTFLDNQLQMRGIILPASSIVDLLEHVQERHVPREKCAIPIPLGSQAWLRVDQTILEVTCDREHAPFLTRLRP